MSKDRVNESPAKRRRLAAGVAAAHSSIALLPDAVLQVCFSFLGSGHYRYVAGTCRRFRNIYTNEHERKTLWENAASSVLSAQLCVEDARRRQNDDGITAHKEILSIAAKEGRVEVLEWARNNRFEFGRVHFQVAARFRHVKVLEWGKANKLDWYSSAVATIAARHGHIDVLDFIWNDRREIPALATFKAVEYGQDAVLSWMKERNLVRGEDRLLWYYAALNGHMDVLNWLRDNGYDAHDAVATGAAGGGHITVLCWARNHGVVFNEYTSMYAAECGHLRVLQWLRENGCPWDGHVIRAAQSGGQAHVVEWARENGCPVEFSS